MGIRRKSKIYDRDRKSLLDFSTFSLSVLKSMRAMVIRPKGELFNGACLMNKVLNKLEHFYLKKGGEVFFKRSNYAQITYNLSSF